VRTLIEEEFVVGAAHIGVRSAVPTIPVIQVLRAFFPFSRVGFTENQFSCQRSRAFQWSKAGVCLVSLQFGVDFRTLGKSSNGEREKRKGTDGR
jgi:hypothetical protein